MGRHAGARIFVSVICLMLGTARPCHAAEPQPPGRQLFLRYCSACHGPQAKGDGVVAAVLQPKPADLTVLASRHGGEFPLEQVVSRIDGRETPRAHGDPAMPIWGQILSEELGSPTKRRLPIERRVLGRILLLTEYLQTIQVK